MKLYMVKIEGSNGGQYPISQLFNTRNVVDISGFSLLTSDLNQNEVSQRIQDYQKKNVANLKEKIFVFPLGDSL